MNDGMTNVPTCPRADTAGVFFCFFGLCTLFSVLSATLFLDRVGAVVVSSIGKGGADMLGTYVCTYVRNTAYTA